MLRGFYANAGMGAANMVAIHPPALISEDIGTFLCFDRLTIDGGSLEYMQGEGGGPEQWIMTALIEQGVLEPRQDLFGPQDVTAAQALFLKTLPELEIEPTDELRSLSPGPSFERQINRIRGENRDQIRGAYYVLLKNYLAMVAARHLSCPIADASEGDIGCRLAILEHDPQCATLPRAHSLSFLLPALRSLLDTIELKIPSFPICVTRHGTPAKAMSLSNQALGQVQSEEPWYLDRRIDIDKSTPRLKTFLNLRQSPRRAAFQSHLLQAQELIDPAMGPDWMVRAIEHHQAALSALERDFAHSFKRPLDALPQLSPQERAQFWRDHPSHAWYGFIREDWMEAVAGRGEMSRLH
jgi:hypothetical protein